MCEAGQGLSYIQMRHGQATADAMLALRRAHVLTAAKYTVCATQAVPEQVQSADTTTWCHLTPLAGRWVYPASALAWYASCA
jgi:hypothetical protein